MLLGPVFSHELAVAPRRPRWYLARTVYPLALLVLTCTAWLVVTGAQPLRTVGDLARFGSLVFQWLSPLQLLVVIVLSAFAAAGAVAQEKDRRTMLLLLMTRMSNGELVLGKLTAALLQVVMMIVAALPVFLFIAVLGGVSLVQVFRVFVVSLCAACAAGSIGSTIAQWREKTFQAVALTALGLVAWIGLGEALASGAFGESLVGVSSARLAEGVSPLRAVAAAARPQGASENGETRLWSEVDLFLGFSLIVCVLLNGLAIWKVRRWNLLPEHRRQIHPEADEHVAVALEPTAAGATQSDAAAHAEVERAGHVDSQLAAHRGRYGESRRVWDNPVLWREVCTWAYGRRVLLIRVVYFVLFFLSAFGLYQTVKSGMHLRRGDQVGAIVPAAARPLAPFMVLSLIILNARAATSITSERDARSLDLLLVSDLSPREFILGKLGGVLWITGETVVLPLLLIFALWWARGLTLENASYVMGGYLVLSLFVAMLGIHCGLNYAASRMAIGVSLGTVFFLFLGVTTLIVLLVAFTGAFQVQVLPFMLFIVGGAIGLILALNSRKQSAAIALACGLMPFLTFWSVVSFLLGQTLGVFLAVVAAFGFASYAFYIPAVAEFDLAAPRSAGQEE